MRAKSFSKKWVGQVKPYYVCGQPQAILQVYTQGKWIINRNQRLVLHKA